MKRHLSLLLLLSMAATPVLAIPQNSTVSQNTFDFDETAFEEIVKKATKHYEQSGSKAIYHTLFEDCYGQSPDYIGVNILTPLESFAFEYAKQNPNSINTFIEALDKTRPKNAEITVEEAIQGWMEVLNSRANKIGLSITQDQLRMLAIFHVSMVHLFDPKLTGFNLFKEIVEYANQQLQ